MSTYAEGLISRRDKTETTEERYNKMVQRRNDVFLGIEKAENYKDMVSVINNLKELEKDGYNDEIDVFMLENKISDRMQELKQTSETRLEELKQEQDKIKSETFKEDVAVTLKVNTEADNILLQLLLQLSMSNDTVKHKTIVSDLLKKHDRATNVALTKLSQMPEYKDLISPNMKEQLLTGIKSKAELKWTERQNNRLTKVIKEMAETTMNSFMLKRVEKLMF